MLKSTQSISEEEKNELKLRKKQPQNEPQQELNHSSSSSPSHQTHRVASKAYHTIKRTSMSVFGNAPTLEIMKLMNKKSGNKDILFRGVEFWYNYRVYYHPYVAPMIWVLGLIICLTGWNTIVGHMIIGGLISLFSCIIIILSYFMIIPWRKHPSTIVLYRTISDLFFSLGIIFMAIDYHVNYSDTSTSPPSSASCGGYPEFLHFFLLASEIWLTIIALDLIYSLTNPFISYKGNMRRYHIICWIFSFIITFALSTNPTCQGRIQGGLCWLSIQDNSCIWGYYLFWIICMYLFQFISLIYSYKKLKKGLPLTFDIRKKCALETFQCLSSYAIYLILLTICFMILITGVDDKSEELNNSWNTFGHVFLYFVASRGYVDSIVWFNQHDFARENTSSVTTTTTSTSYNILNNAENAPQIHEQQDEEEQQHHKEDGHDLVDDEDVEVVDLDSGEQHLPSSSSSSSPQSKLQTNKKKTSRKNSMTSFDIGHGGKNLLDAMNDLGESAVMSFDEADLSPQVNMALRQQIVKYVTMGVTKATSGDYHPDNRHSVNQIEDTFIWCTHAIRALFVKKDPLLSNLQVTQFMLENELPFKEFAPDIFAELRALDGINESHYLTALEKTEKEQLSEGASGAFMFFCGNMEFIVKTIKAAEANVLHRSLGQYLAYLKQNPTSLLVRFFGSYSLDIYAQTFHFVVMKNLFEPGIDINERFDIKGSWVNRNANTSPPNKSIVCRHCNEVFIPAAKEKCTKIIGVHEGNVVLKDNDLRVKISLKRNEAIEVLDIIKKDSDLLAQLGVLDYSLIIGIKKQTFDINNEEDEYIPPSSSSRMNSSKGSTLKQKRRTSSWKAHSISGPAIYYMGIVDFLQDWNMRKRVERALKIYINRQDPGGVSVMTPSPYRDRFQKKMAEIFDLEDYHSDELSHRASASLRGSSRYRHEHSPPTSRFRSNSLTRSRSNSFTPEAISGTVMSFLGMHPNNNLATTPEQSEVELSTIRRHPIDEEMLGEDMQELKLSNDEDVENQLSRRIPNEDEEIEEEILNQSLPKIANSPKVKGFNYQQVGEEHLP